MRGRKYSVCNVDITGAPPIDERSDSVNTAYGIHLWLDGPAREKAGLLLVQTTGFAVGSEAVSTGSGLLAVARETGLMRFSLFCSRARDVKGVTRS